LTRIPIAALVAIAVIAGAAVAGVGLATQRGSHHGAATLAIDENTGRVGRVVLGETRANVIGALGEPVAERSSGVGLEALRYPRLTITLLADMVTSIRTADPAAVTLEAVRIGDPLSAARASYRKAGTCNPSSPDKHAAHPFCRIAVRSGLLLVSGDPIRAITLSADSRS
jgi:hypothetical protein